MHSKRVMQPLADAFRAAAIEPSLCAEGGKGKLAVVEGLGTLKAFQVVALNLADCPVRGTWVLFAQVCERGVLVGIHAGSPGRPDPKDVLALAELVRNLTLSAADTAVRADAQILRALGAHAEVVTRIGAGVPSFWAHTVERGTWTAPRALAPSQLARLGLRP